MSRRAELVGFGKEGTGEQPSASVEVSRSRGRRHGSGLGLRPSRYVGRHRGFGGASDFKPSRAERKAERRGAKQAHDFGFSA
jgi:hypothetical protein